ncbi:phosphate regulon sensor histidine kinase PhoR [Betaproteobacteria bacterium SCN2]|jgi:two-component system phosphate regulon sensor histidine kinase PhoR|nr:phosphate regulon sensor histidine kinase PhoR [Betaproteobacteria bacterium SCN2]
MGFWWRPLITLSVITLIALVLWAGGGEALAFQFAAAALLAYLLRQLWQEGRLARWLEQGGDKPAPSDIGVWGDIFYRLEKLQKRQSQSQSELATALGRFQHAAEAVPDGIVILNEQDRIEWCNPASRQLLGLDAERDRGQFIHYLMRQSDFVDFLEARDFSQQLTINSPAHRDIKLLLQLVPFGAEQKLLMVRDITELERVDAMRRDFVANVSHELRTPLTVVGGFVETLNDLDKPTDADLKHYFGIMLNHTRRMQRLLDDLLTLSRLESSPNTVAEEQVHMPELMRELVREAESLSRGRHVVRLAIDSNDWLSGSLQELQSAFSNLVSNAVRYTPEGGEIALRWAVLNGQPVFSVVDTGEGIPSEHLPRLTERFYRIDRSRSRETGGTGLGLAIVKHILTRHRARLDIQSTPGKGSTFSAIFPPERLIPAQGEEQQPRLSLVK